MVDDATPDSTPDLRIGLAVWVNGEPAFTLGTGDDVAPQGEADHRAVLWALSHSLAVLTAAPPRRAPLVEAVEEVAVLTAAFGSPEDCARLDDIAAGAREAAAALRERIAIIQTAAAEAAGAVQH